MADCYKIEGRNVDANSVRLLIPTKCIVGEEDTTNLPYFVELDGMKTSSLSMSTSLSADRDVTDGFAPRNIPVSDENSFSATFSLRKVSKSLSQKALLYAKQENKLIGFVYTIDAGDEENDGLFLCALAWITSLNISADMDGGSVSADVSLTVEGELKLNDASIFKSI